MPIGIVCPTCGRRGAVPNQHAGKPVRCRGCGGRFVAGGEAGAVLDAEPADVLEVEPADRQAPRRRKRSRRVLAVGRNGQVEFDGERVRISRRGFVAWLAQGVRGDKDLMVSAISGIEFKRNTTFTAGYIQFIFQGGRERQKSMLAGLLGSDSIARNENTVLFGASSQPDFEELKDAVERRLAELHSGRAPAVTSPADELTKLADLRDRGELSAAEYDQAKQRLLGRE